MHRQILFLAFLFVGVMPVLAQPGSPDLNFDGNGRTWVDMGATSEGATAVMALPDGKVLISGMVQVSDIKFGLTRLNPDGSVDNTFGFGGKVITDVGSANAFCYKGGLTPDGKILQVGYGQVGPEVKMILVRYLENGALDNTFGNGGIATIGMAGLQMAALGYTFQPDRKMVLTGIYDDGFTWFLLMRVNDDGSLDTSFDGDGYKTFAAGIVDNAGWDVAVQPDGKIVMVGDCELPGGEEYCVVSRCMSDGQDDTDFGNSGTTLIDYGSQLNHGRAVQLQADGKIIVGGYANTGGDDFFTIARLLDDGTLDLTYGTNGKSFCTFSGGNAQVRDLTMQADGKVILAGIASNGTDSDMAMVRYKTDGNLDADFGAVGRVLTDFGFGSDQAVGCAMTSDQLILLAGNSSNGTENDFAVARYISGVDLNVGEISSVSGSVLIYPNPVQEQFTMEFELTTRTNVTVALYSVHGEKVADLLNSGQLSKGNYRFPVRLPGNLSSGNYLVQLNTEDGGRSVKILVTK